MSKRALIIGTNRDYCYVIREFLELRNLSVTVVLDYSDGIDRLFYEKPDLTVIELLNQEHNPSLTDPINSTEEFEIVDFSSAQKINYQAKPVLIFKNKTQINSLFDFLKMNFSNQESNEPPSESQDKGNLGSTFYPELLVDTYYKNQSGVLSLSSITNLKIYFSKGAPVFAEGGDIETAIGRILLDRGRIDRETYEKAVDMSSKKKLKFGEILFEMGITSPHELNNLLEMQIEEKMINGFSYLDGHYEFVSDSDFTDKIVSYRIDLPKVIYEGVKRYIDAEIIEAEDEYVEISPVLERELSKLGLKPKELRFVQLLKNKASVRETLKTANLEKEDALKLLYFLALFRLVNITGISIDKIGRMSVEKHRKEKDVLRDGRRIEGPEPGEESFFANDTSSDSAPEDRHVETEKESTALYEDGLSGTTDRESIVSTESKSPEVAEYSEYSHAKKGETGNEVDSDQHEADSTYETLEKDSDEIEIESDYFSQLFVDKTKKEITDEGLIDTEIEFSDDDFQLNSAEDEGNEDTAIELSQDTPGTDSDEKISLELEHDDSLRHMGLGEEKTETSDESEDRDNKTEKDLNVPEGLEAGKPEQDHPQSYYKDMELEPELDSQEQPNSKQDLSENLTVPTGTDNPEVGNIDTDASDKQLHDFQAIGDATDEEATPPAGELNIEEELPATHQSEEFAKRVNEFHASMREKDYYEILGVGQNVSCEEIKNAYYVLVKQYHPDSNPNADQAVREKAEDIFTKITSAYDTLNDPNKREQYDSREEFAELKSNAKYIYDAEIAFKKGITLLVQRDYAGAEKKIREALSMNPQEAAYIGTHAWTTFLVADEKSQVLNEVKKTLEKAIAINEKIPENYYYLGSVYKYDEDLKKAERYYNKALEIDPNYIEAKREIRLINTRKHKNAKERKAERRFWSSLFKK